MKILLINNFFYLQGGVERNLFNSAKILQQHGHEILFFSTQHPDNYASDFSDYFVPYAHNLRKWNFISRGYNVLNSIYSIKSRKCIRELLKRYKPDIAHIHDVQFNISPSVIDEIDSFGIPIVMTLHSPKMVCSSNVLFDLHKREICEKCKGGRYYNSIFTRCFDGSFIKGTVGALEMFIHHRMLNIFDKVKLFICPSEFLISKLKEMGFKQKIIHIPNPIILKEYIPIYNSSDRSIVYFGRLSKEKGVDILLESVKGLNVCLKIIGDGSERNKLEEKSKIENINNVYFSKRIIEQTQLIQEVSKSIFSVSPSVCYESFGYSILESFCLGKTVIASDIGAFPELVKDGENGLLFKAGCVESLREKINFLSSNPSLCIKLGINARNLMENNFSPEMFYKSLIKEYNNCLISNINRG